MTNDYRSQSETELFVDLMNEFADEPKTRALLLAILEAKSAPDNQETQSLALSHHLAEIMENQYTPARLYNAIADELVLIEGDFQDGRQTERELRAGCFVPALIAAAAAEKDNSKNEEGKANGKA